MKLLLLAVLLAACGSSGELHDAGVEANRTDAGGADHGPTYCGATPCCDGGLWVCATFAEPCECPK